MEKSYILYVVLHAVKKTKTASSNTSMKNEGKYLTKKTESVNNGQDERGSETKNWRRIAERAKKRLLYHFNRNKYCKAGHKKVFYRF